VDLKVVLAVLAIGGLGLAGFTASRAGSALGPRDDGDALVLETTVERVVTVRRGVTDTRTVLVTKPARVRRVSGPASTAYATQVVLGTVTTSGGTRVLVRERVVPVARTVTVAGPTKTVIQAQGARTRTNVVTQQQVVTNDRIVTSERVVTNERVVTQTVPVTVPIAVPVTQTVRSTETVQLTQTVTVPVTVTEERPPKRP
jgi:hypothetical protein